MPELLTVAEIAARHAGQWVLVGDPVADTARCVEAGRVLFSSHDRDEVYRFAAETRPARFAVLYTGVLSPDVAVVL